MGNDGPLVRAIGFDHVNIKTRDMDRSLAFYTGVLGLPLVRADRDESGRIRFASVRVGALLIDIRQSSAEWSADHTGLNHIAILIEPTDLDALAARLRDRGVTIDRGPVRRQGAFGYGQALYVFDPDGHGVELKHHDLPRLES
jgi:catechol 2,3-dioxygenase-like lactoylglutathione lyase family enzyme